MCATNRHNSHSLIDFPFKWVINNYSWIESTNWINPLHQQISEQINWFIDQSGSKEHLLIKLTLLLLSWMWRGKLERQDFKRITT